MQYCPWEILLVCAILFVNKAILNNLKHYDKNFCWQNFFHRRGAVKSEMLIIQSHEYRPSYYLQASTVSLHEASLHLCDIY
jgi:hypothetical protein